MLICGIHDGHNAAAALVREGEVVGALQEERPRRVKNWHGYPEQAIARLLAAAGADARDVDAWVLAGEETYFAPGNSAWASVSGAPRDANVDQAAARETQVRAYKANMSPLAELKRRLRQTPLRGLVQKRRAQERMKRMAAAGIPLAKVHTVKHHMCHAMTAYHGAGAAADALVVTLDGAGDGLCATVSVPDAKGDLKLLASIPEQHSVGVLWALVTGLMGMVPLEHEYKIMGMAPYAGGARVRAVADKLRRGFQLEGGAWHMANGFPDPNYAYAYVRDLFEFDRFDHICGGLQLFTEELIRDWVRYWLRATGKRKLRLSGGVFMNVKLNKVLAELDEVDDLYIFPSCGDETNAIGAAWGHLQALGRMAEIAPVGAMYLGPAPADEAFDKTAERARAKGLSVERPAGPEALDEAIIARLTAGEPVARFAGGEEFGARALGNRSLLADPARREVVGVLNRAIKSRDFWMPFAPSVLDSEADRYVHNPKHIAAPYMILAFDSRHTEEVEAACHPEDRTIRPQVVARAHNPAYHALLARFHATTGRGALLNTSFNLHGEPIVSAPDDALDVLERSGLENLALGPWMIRKPGRS